MILYSRAKCSDLYTLSESKLLENHTLHSDTYLYSSYLAVGPPSSPPPPRGVVQLKIENNQTLRALDINDCRKIVE